MAIIVRLLNTTIRIRRIQSTFTASGEEQNNVVTVGWGKAARITRNKQIVQSIVAEAGVMVSSTHKVFTNVGIDVEEGDYIYNADDIYVVSFIDEKPGGKPDSHYEIYVNVLGTKSSTPMEIVS